MTEVHLDSTLLKYYGDMLPPDDVLTRLVTLAQADDVPQVPAVRPTLSPQRFLARRRLCFGLAAAACIALAVGGIGYAGFRIGRSNAVPVNPAAASDRATPRLVAVKYYADWCPRCPVIGPLFEILAEKYGNEPVLFVTIDVTDDARRSQSRLLASELGIDWLYDRPRETGMILLLDRGSEEVLARLTETGQMHDLEVVLAASMPHDP